MTNKDPGWWFVSQIFFVIFTPKLGGRWTQFDLLHMFQMGLDWNHQRMDPIIKQPVFRSKSPGMGHPTGGPHEELRLQPFRILKIHRSRWWKTKGVFFGIGCVKKKKDGVCVGKGCIFFSGGSMSFFVLGGLYIYLSLKFWELYKYVESFEIFLDEICEQYLARLWRWWIGGDD